MGMTEKCEHKPSVLQIVILIDLERNGERREEEEEKKQIKRLIRVMGTNKHGIIKKIR